MLRSRVRKFAGLCADLIADALGVPVDLLDPRLDKLEVRPKLRGREDRVCLTRAHSLPTSAAAPASAAQALGEPPQSGRPRLQRSRAGAGGTGAAARGEGVGGSCGDSGLQCIDLRLEVRHALRHLLGPRLGRHHEPVEVVRPMLEGVEAHGVLSRLRLSSGYGLHGPGRQASCSIRLRARPRGRAGGIASLAEGVPRLGGGVVGDAAGLTRLCRGLCGLVGRNVHGMSGISRDGHGQLDARLYLGDHLGEISMVLVGLMQCLELLIQIGGVLGRRGFQAGVVGVEMLATRFGGDEAFTHAIHPRGQRRDADSDPLVAEPRHLPAQGPQLRLQRRQLHGGGRARRMGLERRQPLHALSLTLLHGVAALHEHGSRGDALVGTQRQLPQLPLATLAQVIELLPQLGLEWQ
mmetsp:Transcript_88800/g.287038  ORF Transcript_88800/g.287038 Transcript_88800/m.287038 type:complete len:408 (+) Transcript_88800:1810-3033(+)